jgi:hypothetical protein
MKIMRHDVRGFQRVTTTMLFAFVLATSLSAPNSHGAPGYAGAGTNCNVHVLGRAIVTSPWSCGVEQTGILTLGTCTETSCTIVASGSATGRSDTPEPLRSQYSPAVRSFIARDSDLPGKEICASAGTQEGSSSLECSGTTTFSMSLRFSLFCVFSEYSLGPQTVIVSQRMWLRGGEQPEIGEVFGSGC